jgi:hypothetical protein
MSDDELDQRLREAVLAEPMDVAPLERSIRRRISGPRRLRWALAAAASVALALAASLSYRSFLHSPATPICIAAAEDHEREIVNGEPRPWVSDPAAIDALAEKQGVPASAIAALGTTGYRLERARLCFLKRQIFLHLVYTKDGNEYSVYLRRPGGETSFGKSARGSENLAYFETARLTAVFVSHAPGADALAFARAGATLL